MDCRDLARIQATEYNSGYDIYTISRCKTYGYRHRQDRHIDVDFNTRQLQIKIKEKFTKDGIRFKMVIFDYYWIPNSYLDIKKMIMNIMQLQKEYILATNCIVLLPFCLKFFEQVMIQSGNIKEYFIISYVDKTSNPLWQATQTISGDHMQNNFEKLRQQEDIYCTFTPKNIIQSGTHAHITTEDIKREYNTIPNVKDVRFIKLIGKNI